jgi:hypothetical protein
MTGGTAKVPLCFSALPHYLNIPGIRVSQTEAKQRILANQSVTACSNSHDSLDIVRFPCEAEAVLNSTFMLVGSNGHAISGG